MSNEVNDWVDVSHELPKDDWIDLSHEIKSQKAEPVKTRGVELSDFIPDSKTALAIASGVNDGATWNHGANVAAGMTDPAHYIETRDAIQKQNDDLDKTNVLGRATGKALGGLGSAAMMPFTKLAEGANAAAGAAQTGFKGLMGRIATYAGDGSVAGALQNPGNTEGEIDPQIYERLKNGGTGGKYGAILGAGVEAAQALPDLGSSAIQGAKSLASRKANADEIEKAAQALGVKPTPGMLSDSEALKRTEESLQTNPIFGAGFRKQRDNVYSGVQDSVDNLTKDRTALSNYEVGENFKKGAAEKVHSLFDEPVSLFDSIAEDTKHIPVGQKSLDAISRNSKNISGFGLSRTAEKYVDELQKVKNASDVKTLMTRLNADLGEATGSDYLILKELKDKLSNLEKNSITRAALQSARTQPEGENIAKEMLQSLSKARKGYAEGSTQLGEVASNNRLGPVSSPNNFVDKVESIPSENIPNKFFNTGDTRAIETNKAFMPEQMEQLRQARLAEIYKKSLNGEKISSAKFLGQTGPMTPEGMTATFGESGPGNISNLKTVSDAIPKSYNPSGTAAQSGWDYVSPTKFAQGAGNLIAYKGQQILPEMANSKVGAFADMLMKSSPRLADLAQRKPDAFNLLVQSMAPKEPIAQPAQQGEPNNDKLLQILAKDPSKIDSIKNPRLKEQLLKMQNRHNPKDLIPAKEAQDQFIDGN